MMSSSPDATATTTPTPPTSKHKQSFSCRICGEPFAYDCFGKNANWTTQSPSRGRHRPPSSQQQHRGSNSAAENSSVIFLEDVYMIRDPFASPDERNCCGVLCLGGVCGLCGASVCVKCSLYYTKRFCLPCAKKNADCFPPEVARALL